MTLEDRVGSGEEVAELELVGESDSLQHKIGVLDPVQNVEVIKVAEVDYELEG